MQVKPCQLCGKLAPITHTCKLCKRQVCQACYQHEANLCTQCHKHLEVKTPLLTFPLKLLFLGFVLILAGTILLIASALLHGNAQTTTSIIILIGPIPIILGTGPNSILAIIIATILAILTIAFFLLLQKRR